MQHISSRQLADWLADASRPQPVLLDVREAAEFDICHLPGAQLMPMHTVPLRVQELSPEVDTVVICHHGGRSMQVAMFLKQRGFSRLYNLSGGINGWACSVDPNMPQY